MKTKKNGIRKRVLSSILAFATALSGFTFTPVSSNTVETEAATSAPAYEDLTLGEKIVYKAMEYLGYGYGSGGSRTSGYFDCTGLIQAAMEDVGFTNVPQGTSGWLTQIQNGTLNLGITGETIKGYKYASSLSEYNSWVNDPSYSGYVIVLQNPVSSDEINASAEMTAGTIIVTAKDGDNDAHGMIYIDDIPITTPISVSDPSTDWPAAFYKAVCAYFDTTLNTMMETYANMSDSTSRAYIGNCKAVVDTAYASYSTVASGVIDSASLTNLWSYKSQNFYIISNGSCYQGADVYGTDSTVGNTKWVIDDGSYSSGVRLINKIGGKGGNASEVYLVSFNYPDSYYAKLGVKKVSSSSSSTNVSGAVYAISDSLTTLNTLAKTTYSSASAAKSTAEGTTGVTALTTSSSGTVYFTDVLEWDDSESATKTFYIKELYSPTGYDLESGYYTVTVTGTNDSDGAAATITSVKSSTGSSISLTTSSSGDYVTLADDVTTTSHTVTKVLSGTGATSRINYVKVRLYRNNSAQSSTATLTDGSWSHTFTGLTKYNSSGVEYTYTAKEYEVNYTDMYGDTHTITDADLIETLFGSVTSTSGSTTTITNTYQTTSLPVQKSFSDNAGAYITKVQFQLSVNGTAVDKYVTVDSSTGWTGTFTNLDKLDENGDTITYTANEYKVWYTDENGNEKTLTGLSNIKTMFNVSKTYTNGTSVTTNAPIRLYGAISVEKVNSENETVKIAGVRYGVYSDASCTDQITTITTDSSGIATYTVSQPWYKLNGTTKTVYIKEISTVSPYIIDDTVYKVVITGSTSGA